MATTMYRVAAYRPMSDGRKEDLNEAATLGRALGVDYATRAEAQAVADDLASSVSLVGLDPETIYEVEEVEVSRYRIVGGSLPQDVDADGYDSYAAAEGMASEYAEGDYRIEAY